MSMTKTATAIGQKIKALAGSTPQGYAGVLVRDSQYVWRYDAKEQACALALTMPIRAQSYNSHQPHPIFAMNLPEGAQLDRLSKRFVKEFSKFDDMAILSIVGQDQIGRVRLTQEANTPRSKKASIGLSEILKSKANDGLFEYLTNTFYESGISGVQPKVLVPDADATPPKERLTAKDAELIVKTGGSDYEYLSQNEFLCMQAAKHAGIEVPEFHLSDDGSLLVIRRFDILVDGVNDDQQLGFEDMAVLSNASYDQAGHYKYKSSYENVAKILSLFCTNNMHLQLQKFFDYLVLSCMVRNGDAHLKNFGLLYTSPADRASIRLAPLFDVVTTSVYRFEDKITGRSLADQTLALKLNKSNAYPKRRELIEFGKRYCFVSHPELVIDRIAQACTDVMKQYKSLFPTEFGNRMAQEWELGKVALV